jgi:hypothetical protein
MKFERDDWKPTRILNIFPRRAGPTHTSQHAHSNFTEYYGIYHGSDCKRTQALSNTPPHIIECASATAGESQTACHLPPLKRFASLGQKGATLWMTGCSGSGKTTITTALEEKVVKEYGKHVYRLDGDNLRTGLNRDFRFSESDGAESVRRTGELATLFSDGGMITLVGLISPYRQDRDEVRKRRSETNTDFEHFPKTGGPRTHESACPFQFH